MSADKNMQRSADKNTQPTADEYADGMKNDAETLAGEHIPAERAIARSIGCNLAAIVDILLSPPKYVAPSSLARAFSDKMLGTFDLLSYVLYGMPTRSSFLGGGGGDGSDGGAHGRQPATSPPR